MRFIDLQQIALELGQDQRLTTPELFAFFLSNDTSTKKIDTSELISCTAFELFQFLDVLKTENALIFYDWVMTDAKLPEVLLNGKFPNRYIEKHRFKGHLLEKSFYTFLTPFLSPILLQQLNEAIAQSDFKFIALVMDFSGLIVSSESLRIQARVNEYLRSHLNIAFEFPSNSSEKVMLEQVHFLNAPMYVDVYNFLDKSFYSTRVELVKKIGALAGESKMTNYSLRLLKPALSRLELNPSHRRELLDFFDQTVAAKNNKRQTKDRVRLKKVTHATFTLGMLIVVIGCIIWLNPDNKPIHAKRNQSGLDSLTIEEMMEVDTLLGLKIDSEDFQFEKDVATIPTAVVPAFVFPDDFIQNELVAALHKSMVADFGIQENMLSFEVCHTIPLVDYKTTNYQGVFSTDALSGPFHKIKNQSNYDAYILVFDNTNQGKVFGRLIPKSGAIHVGVKDGQHVLFYIGNDMAKFNPAKEYNRGYKSIQTAQEVDKVFDHHYCDLDVNTLLQLRKILKVDATHLSLSTILKGDDTSGFEIQSKVIVPAD
jgi:hypothetical protein